MLWAPGGGPGSPSGPEALTPPSERTEWPMFFCHTQPTQPSTHLSTAWPPVPSDPLWQR